MFEVYPTGESDPQEKAWQWLDDARSAIESTAPMAQDPSNERLVQRMERGILISDARVEMIAEFQAHREDFLAQNGVDIILEQFFVLKEVVKKI